MNIPWVFAIYSFVEILNIFLTTFQYTYYFSLIYFQYISQIQKIPIFQQVAFNIIFKADFELLKFKQKYLVNMVYKWKQKHTNITD